MVRKETVGCSRDDSVRCPTKSQIRTGHPSLVSTNEQGKTLPPIVVSVILIVACDKFFDLDHGEDRSDGSLSFTGSGLTANTQRRSYSTLPLLIHFLFGTTGSGYLSLCYR